MDFVIGLPILTDEKGESYNSILIIVGWLIKIMYYELVKIIIIASRLAKVILDIVVWYHGLLNSIVSDKSLLFISKFWLLLYYFLGIKQRLSIAFHPQINS